jgi:hypothetical protein
VPPQPKPNQPEIGATRWLAVIVAGVAVAMEIVWVFARRLSRIETTKQTGMKWRVKRASARLLGSA